MNPPPLFLFPAFCEEGCRSGGTCVSPNTCVCPSGFTGRRCETGKTQTLASQHVYQNLKYQVTLSLSLSPSFCLSLTHTNIQKMPTEVVSYITPHVDITTQATMFCSHSQEGPNRFCQQCRLKNVTTEDNCSCIPIGIPVMFHRNRLDSVLHVGDYTVDIGPAGSHLWGTD